MCIYVHGTHSNTTMGKKGGEGEGEVEIIHMCIYMLLPV